MFRGNPRRFLHLIGALLTSGVIAAPAIADDWNACAKESGDAALAACTRAIRSGTYTGRVLALAYSNRGVEWKARGDVARAIADYDEAVKHDPQQPAAFNNRGLAHASKSDYDRALADYDEAIRLNPKYAAALNNRGLAYFRKGQHQRAIADYDEAIRLEPDAVRLNNRGNAYASRGQLDRAVQDFDEALALDPRYAIAFYNRGARSRTTTRRSRSIPSTRTPSSTAASPTSGKASWSARSPTTTRRSGSIRVTQSPTTTAATRC
jgi:tetratricopeptide (TPR) repeat protein